MLRRVHRVVPLLVLSGLLACGSKGDGPTAPDAPSWASFPGVYDYTTTEESGSGSPIFGELTIAPMASGANEFTGSLDYKFVANPDYGGENDLEVSGTIDRASNQVSFRITGGPQRDWTVTAAYADGALSGEYVLRGGNPIGSIVYTGDFSAKKQ